MFSADKKIILRPGTKPSGNYSQGILIDATPYISGQGGEDVAGQIPSDFDAEAKQCPDNIGAVLKAAGMSPADVVSVQVYLTDAAKFQRMNAVYTSYFKDPPTDEDWNSSLRRHFPPSSVSCGYRTQS